MTNKLTSQSGQRVYYYFSWNSRSGHVLRMCGSEKSLEHLILQDFPQATPRMPIYTGILSDLTPRQKYECERRRIRLLRYREKNKYKSVIQNFLAHIFYDALEAKVTPTLPNIFENIHNLEDVYDYAFENWTHEQVIQVGKACEAHDYFQDRKFPRNK